MLKISRSKRRWLKMLAAGLIFSTLCGLLAFYLLDYYYPDLNPVSAEKLYKRLEIRLGYISFIVPPGFFKQHPHLTAFLIGFLLLGGLATAARLRWFHDRFLETFDDTVLTRVNRVSTVSAEEAQFVQLAWTLGEGGARRAAWDSLDRWARAPLPQGSSKLKMALLVGRSGSGKSRLGHQLARELARRDLLGGDTPSASYLWRIAAYLRHVLPLIRASLDDPWDAGILVPKKERGEDFVEFCERLAKWKPRRPTILLLDDPLDGECAAAWQALATGSEKLAHPVRLLIINQTVPRDTKFSFSPERKLWLFGREEADPPPVMLPSDAWFTEQETRRVIFATPAALKAAPKDADFIRKEAHRLTQGNPLLVSLAVEWVRDDRGPLTDMTAETLPKARAIRIVESLAARGIDSDAQLAALAVATLVHGAEKSRLQALLSDAFPMAHELPSATELQACFPTEPLVAEGGTVIPAVRPDLIADAFVATILERIGKGYASTIAHVAFRIDPSRMLRNLRRIRLHSSTMAKALLEVDPAKIDGLDPVDLALAYADIAAICDIDERPLSTTGSRISALDATRAAVGHLDGAQKSEFCRRLIEHCRLTDEQSLRRQIRPWFLEHIVFETAEASDVALPIELLPDFIDRLKVMHHDFTSSPEGVVRVLSDAPADLRYKCVNRMTHMGERWRSALLPVAQGIMADVKTNAGERCFYGAVAARGDLEKIRQLDAFFQGEAKTAEIALWQLRALSMITRDYSQTPEGSLASEASISARLACAIADRFPSDDLMAEEAVRALCFEMQAWSQIATEEGSRKVEEAIQTVETLVDRFQDNVMIAYLWAFMLRYRGSFHADLPDGHGADETQRLAEFIETIRDRHPDSALLAEETVIAYANAAKAWNAVPDGAQAPACHHAANKADKFAQLYPHDWVIAYYSASALTAEARCWQEIPEGKEAVAAAAAAASVSAIADRFPDMALIASASAWALSAETFAWCHRPAGAGAYHARASCAAVIAIADRFLDQQFPSFRALRASRFEAYAHGARCEGSPSRCETSLCARGPLPGRSGVCAGGSRNIFV